MKIKKLLLTLMMLFTFIGCNTTEESYDTSDFDDYDNSELSGFYNTYGYFGEDVIFGEQNVVGIWVLYDTSSDSTLYTKFYDDGEMLMGDGSIYTYGVAASGLSINISTGETIVIKTSEIYKQTEDELDCYRVNIVSSSNTTSTADMCPDN